MTGSSTTCSIWWRAMALTTTRTTSGECSMPILTASTPMSSTTASICALQHVGRNAVDGAHALGVLRGDRGDRGHAVAAQRAEGLEVGLDAGAAAAVGAGNREHTHIARGPGGREGRLCHAKNYGLCATSRRALAACAVIPARTKQGCPARLARTEKHPGAASVASPIACRSLRAAIGPQRKAQTAAHTSVWARTATQCCESRASASRQGIGDATLVPRYPIQVMLAWGVSSTGARPFCPCTPPTDNDDFSAFLFCGSGRRPHGPAAGGGAGARRPRGGRVRGRQDAAGHGSAARVAAAMLAPLAESAVTEPGVVRMGQHALARWPQLLAHAARAGVLPARTARWWSGTGRTRRKRRACACSSRPRTARCRHCRRCRRSTAPAWRACEPALAGRFAQGLYLPGEGQLDNRQLLDALLRTRWRSWAWPCTGTRRARRPTLPPARRASPTGCSTAAAWARAPQWRALRGVRGEVVRVHAPEVCLQRPTRLVHPRYPLYIAPKQDHLFVIGATEIESDDMSPASVRSTLELLSAAYAVHRALPKRASSRSPRSAARPCPTTCPPSARQRPRVLRSQRPVPPRLHDRAGPARRGAGAAADRTIAAGQCLRPGRGFARRAQRSLSAMNITDQPETAPAARRRHRRRRPGRHHRAAAVRGRGQHRLRAERRARAPPAAGGRPRRSHLVPSPAAERRAMP